MAPTSAVPGLFILSFKFLFIRYPLMKIKIDHQVDMTWTFDACSVYHCNCAISVICEVFVAPKRCHTFLIASLNGDTKSSTVALGLSVCYLTIIMLARRCRLSLDAAFRGFGIELKSIVFVVHHSEKQIPLKIYSLRGYPSQILLALFKVVTTGSIRTHVAGCEGSCYRHFYFSACLSK